MGLLDRNTAQTLTLQIGERKAHSAQLADQRLLDNVFDKVRKAAKTACSEGGLPHATISLRVGAHVKYSSSALPAQYAEEIEAIFAQAVSENTAAAGPESSDAGQTKKGK